MRAGPGARPSPGLPAPRGGSRVRRRAASAPACAALRCPRGWKSRRAPAICQWRPGRGRQVNIEAALGDLVPTARLLCPPGTAPRGGVRPWPHGGAISAGARLEPASAAGQCVQKAGGRGAVRCGAPLPAPARAHCRLRVSLRGRHRRGEAAWGADPWLPGRGHALSGQLPPSRGCGTLTCCPAAGAEEGERAKRSQPVRLRPRGLGSPEAGSAWARGGRVRPFSPACCFLGSNGSSSKGSHHNYSESRRGGDGDG